MIFDIFVVRVRALHRLPLIDKLQSCKLFARLSPRGNLINISDWLCLSLLFLPLTCNGGSHERAQHYQSPINLQRSPPPQHCTEYNLGGQGDIILQPFKSLSDCNFLLPSKHLSSPVRLQTALSCSVKTAAVFGKCSRKYVCCPAVGFVKGEIYTSEKLLKKHLIRKLCEKKIPKFPPEIINYVFIS